MRALTFWKAITMDREEFLEKFLALLKKEHVRFCLIGGQAVNAYAEPVVSLDLDVVVAADQIEKLEQLLKKNYRVKHFERSTNVSARDSNLQVQIQRDPRYFPFIERATEREVLGLTLPVATIEDVLQGKTWAALDPERRASKRQKDLADIARLLDAAPQLRKRVPADILEKLLS